VLEVRDIVWFALVALDHIDGGYRRRSVRVAPYRYDPLSSRVIPTSPTLPCVVRYFTNVKESVSPAPAVCTVILKGATVRDVAASSYNIFS
jgi:hypothetical protein